ncbi:MAG TPA: LCP family protein [Bacillales bacterium]|nr:LCP family protein [Bacillales bacterium]
MAAACVFGVLLIGGGVYAYQLYDSVKDAANKMYEPVKNPSGDQEGGSSQGDGKAAQPEHKAVDQGADPRPISILLMGVDERTYDVGRSDTLMVLTLNPDTNTMQMISIPRDTRVMIPGDGPHSGIHKINAAYAYGGTALEMKTVKHYLDIPLDYYIRINMEGLADLVDAVGGIRVYNDISWHDEGYYKKGYFYQKGWITLNGPQALGYVRMRHLDPRGDIGRNERQREVIQAIIDKAASYSSFAQYQDILDAISENVRTNLTFDDMKYIALHYRDAQKNLKTYEVKGHGGYINDIWWYIVSDSERQRVHDMIMAQLENGGGSENAQGAE